MSDDEVSESGFADVLSESQEFEQQKRRSMLMIRSEHRLRQENLAFDIDVWYPIVADLTPRTRFVPLRRIEAAAIVAHYKNWMRVGGGGSFELTEEHLQALLGRAVFSDLQRS
jgi:hypothetical protein